MNEHRTLGRFRTVRRLGAGGLAEIYLAEVEGPQGFRRDVAIKRLHPHLASSSPIVELFVQEACITAKLHHPNIVQVHGLEEHDGELFMVMEHVEGMDLRQILDHLASRSEALPSDLCLVIAIEVAKALQYAHAVIPPRAGRHPPIIHRDLSPGNIMVSVSGTVKLLDFGVAKALLGDDAADQVARGKWPYMSPEQVRGEPLDPRSDLFSLGSVLFELLTGRQAFAGRTVVDSMRRVEQADLPPAPGVDPVVEAILNKLLARQRDERYPDAGAALSAMSQVLLLRGWVLGERAMAEWLSSLDVPLGGEVPVKASAPVRVDDVSGVGLDHLVPREPVSAVFLPGQGQDGTSAVTVALHKGGQSTARPHPQDSFGMEDVTLPPLGGSAEPTAFTSHSRNASGPSADEEAEVTADRTTSVDGRRTRRSAPARKTRPTPSKTVSPQEPSLSPMPSEPRVYFDHFMPSEVMEEDQAQPPLWTTRNLLVVSMALLAILIAGLAVFIAVKRQASPKQRETNLAAQPPVARALTTEDAGVSSMTDARPEVTSRPPAHSSDAPSPRPRSVPKDAQPESPLPRNPPPDAGSASRPTSDPAPSDGSGRPPKGLPSKGQVDIITQPKGALILLDGLIRGTAPLRLDVTPGARLQLTLNLKGRGLYRTPLWVPPNTGRRMDVILPYLSKPFTEAKPGRTAIRVICSADGSNRVFFNNVDTGFNCPTPPIATLPVPHSVSVFMGRTQQFQWKQVRPAAGTVSDVTF